MNQDYLKQGLLYDKKWHRLARRAGIFCHVPFVDFVFGSGSLAIGNVDEESDFDVLIGVAEGRIFTVRFLSALFLSLRGWRRSKEHGGVAAADKVCLNHFVTKPAYRLRLPINTYWKVLYSRLVPLYGEQAALQAFLDANADWAGVRVVESNDLRYQGASRSKVARLLERMLVGSLGNRVEAMLRRYQVARIAAGVKAVNSATSARTIRVDGVGKREVINLAPLIVYTDEELEFHPDPAVIEIG